MKESRPPDSCVEAVWSGCACSAEAAMMAAAGRSALNSAMPRMPGRGVGMGWETGEECPHEWGHGSLKGYATVHRRRGNELRMGCREKSNQFKTESAAS